MIAQDMYPELHRTPSIAQDMYPVRKIQRDIRPGQPVKTLSSHSVWVGELLNDILG